MYVLYRQILRDICKYGDNNKWREKNYWNFKGPFIRYLSSDPIQSRLKQCKEIKVIKRGVKMRMVARPRGKIIKNIYIEKMRERERERESERKRERETSRLSL